MLRAVAAMLAAVAGLAGAGAAQTPRIGPASAARILGGPAVSIETGAPDWSAFTATVNALNAAEVRFVVEGAPFDPENPQIDLAKPPGDPVILTGLTVREALDRIARENARFRWSEIDGIVVARLTRPGTGLLDAKLAQFSVNGANARTAMGELVARLAPDWDPATRIAILPRAAAGLGGIRSPSSQPTGSLVTLTTGATTVQNVLVRLARESGAWSWMLSYDRQPVSTETASIRVVAGDELIQASAPGVSGPGWPPRSEPSRLMLGPDLRASLNAYARSANVILSFEEVPGVPRISGPRALPPVNLAGVAPATAVRWIVSLDSRYDWQERGGRFIVRPKRATRTILDATVQSFTRINEPLEAVLTDILTRAGAELIRSTEPGGPGNAAAAAARQRLVSVDYRQSATLREILEALCTAAGDVSWIMRSTGAQAWRPSYELTLQGVEGWSFSRSFSVVEPPAVSRPPETALPPDVDRDVRRSVPSVLSLVSPFLAVASSATAPMGIELAPSSRLERDPRWVRTVQMPPMPPPAASARLSDLLYQVLERNPGTTFQVRNGVINVAPRETWAARDHFLDRPLGRFDAQAETAWRVAVRLRQRLNRAAVKDLPMAEQPPQFGLGSQNEWANTVTFTLENPTAREVLNALVTAHGNLAWLMRYESLQPDRDASVRDEDAVLVLVMLNDLSGSGMQFDRNGAMTITRRPVSSSPFARSPTPGVPAGPQPHLQLPPRDRREIDIDRLCRGLKIRCAVELITEKLPGPAVSQVFEGYYDFTGLEPTAALATLTDLMPDLTWRRDGEVYRLRSRALDQFKDLPLDRRVPTFEHDLANIPAIRQAVQVLFRGMGVGSQSGLIASVGGVPIAPADRPVAVRMKNATVREILDEVVRLHGELSWSVRYLNANGTIPQLEFTLSRLNGSESSVVYLNR